MQESELKGSPLLYSEHGKELDLAAANRFKKALDGFANEKYIIIGCCGGNSPKLLYELLAEELIENGQEILPKIHIFLVDERILTQSQIEQGGEGFALNTVLVQEHLIKPLLNNSVFNENQFHGFPQPEDPTKDPGVSSYFSELKKYGGRFHAVILGSGVEGHIAGVFPFPHITSEDEKTSEYKYYVGAPKPPPKRMTASLALLAESAFGMVLFRGDKKQEPLESFFKTDDPRAIPACIVKKMSKHVVVTDIKSPLVAP